MAALLRWIVVALILVATPAEAVIIDSGDGTGNTTAPPDDPGWIYLASIGGLSGVYLGDGWLLTANHVGLGTVTLAGGTYEPVVGSEVRLSNGDGTFADLKVFAIHGFPDLPLLPIRATTPPIGTPLIMEGQGRNRGPTTSWSPGTLGPFGGYEWGAGRARRWGTNLVDGYPLSDPFNTVSFYTVFDEGDFEVDPNVTEHEAQAAAADSGGTVWIHDGTQWELAGILFAIDTQLPGCPVPTDPDYCFVQPTETALYENATYAADLSFYRDEIVAIVALPEPGGLPMLAAGLATLLALGRRRFRP